MGFFKNLCRGENLLAWALLLTNDLWHVRGPRGDKVVRFIERFLFVDTFLRPGKYIWSHNPDKLQHTMGLPRVFHFYG